MDRYDIVDSTIINAPVDQVWRELIAELNGAANWWTPHNTFEPGFTGPEHVGGTTLVTVHTKGVDKGGPKLRFTATTTSVTPGRQLAADYTDGAFRGRSVFDLTPVDGDTRTRLSMTFTATPQGWLSILAKVANIGAQHSQATQNAFSHLNTRLTSKGTR
ncbi:SRPBCC family protein [Kitasatospora sp. NPDC097643]|uniref:SRPBCC family protein n=1 Tax=Kitasatospora sp. NPDC097643 TaxID=3157230 RepID=UPI003327A7B9